MFGVVLASLLVIARQDPKPDAAREEFQALLSRYEVASKLWEQKHGAEADPVARYRDWPAWSFIPEVLVFAEEHAGDPSSADALLWVVKRTPEVGATDRFLVPHLGRALELLAKDVGYDDPRVRDAFVTPLRYPSPAIERFVRAALEKGRDRETRGLACLALGRLLAGKAELAASQWGEAKPDAPFAAFLWTRNDPAVVKYVRATDPKAARAEAAALLDRAAGEFADVVYRKGTAAGDGIIKVGAIAKIERDRLGGPDGR